MIENMTLQVHMPEGVDPQGDAAMTAAWDSARRLATESGATIVGNLQFVGLADNGASNWTVPAHRPEARI